MQSTVSTPEAWVALSLRAVPHAALVALLRAFGGPVPILAATRAQLAAIVPNAAVARVLAAPAPAVLERTIAWLAEPGHGIVAWDDPEYPQALLNIGHAPPVLYVVGRRDCLNRPALAIVGSRNATAQGLDNAQAFARTLGQAGLTIVSGLAAGVDGAAHRGALGTAGSTIAVVGTGPDRVYPAEHRELAHQIAAEGALVSQFPLGTPPTERNFPRRNRLISGLSRGVLVVEAALSSGSLITARYAGEQGREVFAIPGSIHSPLAKGSHRLIRDGAKLVETAQDVLEEFGLISATTVPDEARPAESDDPVLIALGDDPAGVDMLVARTGLTAQAISARLTALELAGIATSVPGGRWQRRR